MNLRVPKNLEECFEGTFAALKEDNETDALSGRCLQKMPDGVVGDEVSVDQVILKKYFFIMHSLMPPN